MPHNTPAPQQPFSLRNLCGSIGHALCGLRACFKSQRNARFHTMATLGVIACGFLLGINANDWRWIIAAITAVWVAELLNTAIEQICDIISPQYHDGVKIAKDIAAAAVLVATLFAIITGLITFLPYVCAFMRGQGWL